MFLKQINDNSTTEQWVVDSAAIGSWHVGKKPGKILKTTKNGEGSFFRIAFRLEFGHTTFVN